jgi:PDZ domain-containing protein
MSEEAVISDDVTAPQPPQPPQPPGHPVGQLHPLTALLLVAVFAAVLLLSVLMLLPVPYAVLVAGPTTNTLGEDKGVALISISGHQTYPTTGALDLTTVRIYGGPGSRVSPWQLVTGWLDDATLIVPQEQLFPPGQTPEQTKEENQLEMASSQESATAAALRTLGYPVPEHMRVSDFTEASPSKGTLQVGDVIRSVGGVAIVGGDELRAELQKVTPGKPAPMVVRRGGKDVALSPLTKRGTNGVTVLGVIVDPVFEFPFQVKIQIENVGGPSAGAMFALGIIDKLTPGPLTGGRTVAGTGTIDPDGVIGPIGGIRQKLIGARESGATVFLAPADNCSEVVGRIPDGLSVIKVATLAEARAALEHLDSPAGEAGLPRCG